MGQLSLAIAIALILGGMNPFDPPAKKAPRPPVDVVFYNVENLFDTLNDPNIIDEEFTPDSTNHWTNERYQKKLRDLAKVIAAVPKDGLPEVIGLCEIENRSVVEALFNTDILSTREYRVVHEESADARGIDVALVYDAKLMKELNHSTFRFGFVDGDEESTTRDILYVKLLAEKDTLHFFVNHWPSRRGGQETSEHKRLKAATILRAAIDSIVARDENAKVVAMGDFNDHPNDRSMTEIMNCKPGVGAVLSNLTYDLHESGMGTYNYKGEWGMLDQFIVSTGLLEAKKGLMVSDTSAYIFKQDWLLFKEGDKEAVPSKTYGGPNYYGGYSDHLPIGLTLKLR